MQLDQWKFISNQVLFVLLICIEPSKNAFENVVCHMVAILSRPQCVKNSVLSSAVWIVAPNQVLCQVC